MWMYHKMHFVAGWALLTSMYAPWMQSTSPSSSPEQYLEQRRGSVNTMEWMALFWPGKRCKSLYNPMPFALSFRSPRDPAKSGAARCPFCSTPRCSAFVAWLASGSTSLSEQKGCPCMCTCICTYTEELQQRYEGDPCSREKVYLLNVVAQPANTTDQGHLAGLRVSQEQLN